MACLKSQPRTPQGKTRRATFPVQQSSYQTEVADTCTCPGNTLARPATITYNPEVYTGLFHLSWLPGSACAWRVRNPAEEAVD
jgi:hypothetical protein